MASTDFQGSSASAWNMKLTFLVSPSTVWPETRTEPSLGLSPQAMAVVFATIRALTEDGITVLMVEQNAQQALGRCDHGAVMELGKVSLFAPAAAVLSHPGIRRMFLGL